jgi:hypothetical protein
MNIIGYIHVCQRGQWKRSFQLLLHSIKNSGLYDETDIIRIGIVNDDGIMIDDPIFYDTKFRVIYVGKSEEYERPTLLHMRKKSEEDPEGTLYYYLHTKGIRHFGNENEPCILDWIHFLLYWNIEKWGLAINNLKTHDIYGCNDTGTHYSGNFWWARKEHITSLTQTIDSYYNAPEDWIQSKPAKKFCAWKSGFQGMADGAGHYVNLYPRSKYT